MARARKANTASTASTAANGCEVPSAGKSAPGSDASKTSLESPTPEGLSPQPPTLASPTNLEDPTFEGLLPQPPALASPTNLEDPTSEDPLPKIPGPVIPTTFHSFSRLAVEIRAMIWTEAKPEPAIIMQVNSKSMGAYHYIRSGPPIPAVLHTCRESRVEYLETDANDASMARRREAHPVYRWCFSENRSGRKKRGCYMATNYDNLWLTNTHTRQAVAFTTRRDRFSFQNQFAGGLTLPTIIANRLEHITLSPFELLPSDLHSLLSKFPGLKTLTFLVRNSKFIPWTNDNETELIMPPEVDGQIDLEAIIDNPNFDVDWLIYAQGRRQKVLRQWCEKKEIKNIPQLMWRSEDQLFEKTGLVLPVLPPEDPLKPVFREMLRIDRRRADAKDKAQTPLQNN